MTVPKWDMDRVYHQLHLHKHNFCDLIDLKYEKKIRFTKNN